MRTVATLCERWVFSTARMCRAMIDEFKDVTVMLLVSAFAP